MSYIIKTIAVATLVSTGFTVTTSTATPIRTNHASCVETYTIGMFRNAAITAYRATRTPTRRDLSHLRRFVHCARHTWGRPVDHRIWARSISMNHTRRLVAVSARAVYPESPLAVCIIRRESGGNRLAVNGQYEGIAQWSQSSWLGGGGGRFSSYPLGATYNQQVIVLNDMLPAQAGQWKPYDGC